MSNGFDPTDKLSRERLEAERTMAKAMAKRKPQTSDWIQINENTIRRFTMKGNSLKIETKRTDYPGRGKRGSASKPNTLPLVTRESADKEEPKQRVFEPMGSLKHGNPAGNPNNAVRCGAQAKSTGKPCQAPAMKNGRCRLHGGKSTGAKTPEGIERSKRGNWKHGEQSQFAKAENKKLVEGMGQILKPKQFLGMPLEEIVANIKALERHSDFYAPR